MTEDPIKLFSTRAERYPQPSDADLVHGTARAALAAIPLVGGSMTEVMSMVLAPALARRREEWLKELADGLEELERKVEGFRIEALQDDEAFVSAVIESSRSAISTHKTEKREALRNALLNIALHRSTDEDQQQIFLRYIDELTVWHLRFLRLFQAPEDVLTAAGVRFGGGGGFASPTNRVFNYTMGGPSRVVELAFPELQDKRELYDQIATDLRARGMLNSSADFLHTTMSASGMLAKRTTAMADAFLAFIENPLQ